MATFGIPLLQKCQLKQLSAAVAVIEISAAVPTCGIPAAPMLAAVAVIEIAKICPIDRSIPLT